MSSLHLAWRLALVSLSVVTASAMAQQQGAAGRQNDGRVHERVDLQTCQTSGGGTRRRANCEPEPVTVRTEQELKITLEPPPLRIVQCSATATTSYSQRNTVARVESKIEIASCTVATGEMTVAVHVRDESGEVKPLEFQGSWQRSDDQDVHFAADYPIGENVELVGVRLRGLRCTCADAAAGPSADAAGRTEPDTSTGDE